MVARAFCLVLAVAACGQHRASGAGRPAGPPAMPVQIEAVKSVPLRDATEYVGVLRSRQSVQIQPLVEGHVSKILVTSGDEVQPRAPLIDIDPSRQRAAVSNQRALNEANVASLDLARKQYARIERLFNKGAATRQDFDQAQNGLRQAEANVGATRAQTQAQAVELRYFQVAAPVAGTVGDIPVRVGDLVTTQTLLTTLDDNSTLEAYIDVPTERAATLKLGTRVEIIDAASEVIAPSEVSFVSPRADPATQMVDGPGQRRQSGRPAARRAVRARPDRLASSMPGRRCRCSRVQRRAGQAFVWVVNEKDGAQAAAERAPPFRSGRLKDRAIRSPAGCRQVTVSSRRACRSSARARASRRSPPRPPRRTARHELSREGGRALLVRARRGGRGTPWGSPSPRVRQVDIFARPRARREAHGTPRGSPSPRVTRRTSFARPELREGTGTLGVPIQRRGRTSFARPVFQQGPDQ